MKKHSTNNSFSESNGDRISRNRIERKIRKSKEIKLAQQLHDYCYNFCEECKSNACKPLDCSHVISVKECLERGAAELCWDLDNIRILGRNCHNKHDKTNLQFTKI